jgi:glycosyltransferase involved in cell wall biosynthesis
VLFRSISRKLKMNNVKNFELVGFKNKNQLIRLIQESEYVIVPSQWYEIQPYSILETYANGKAVVASKIGGIPEIVRDGKTGLLFNVKDIDDFKYKILFLWNNSRLAKKMGIEGKKYALKNHSTDNYYQKLMNIYKTALDTRKYHENTTHK